MFYIILVKDKKNGKLIQHSNIGNGKIYDKDDDDDDEQDEDKVIHTPAANPKLPSRIFLWNYQTETDNEKDTCCWWGYSGVTG